MTGPQMFPFLINTLYKISKRCGPGLTH
uniref:Uncharacterized protein n=1 Tax=Anguilla anguilla TaxID=7936 RepID=A0A0E9XZQ4_ANGAN